MSFLCRTNFLVDVVCSFPTDIIVLAIWPDNLGKLNTYSCIRLVFCNDIIYIRIKTVLLDFGIVNINLFCFAGVLRILSLARLNRCFHMYKVVSYTKYA